jgi:oligopeptide transport system substrate-binding protein
MSLTRRTLAASTAAIGLMLGLEARADQAGDLPPSTRANTIHIGNGAEPLTLDPHQASGTWENRIIGDMLIGLTTEDAAGLPIPGMATEWTTSPDGLVWTFKLRDGKWSDGVPVTAGDFEYAMRRILTLTPPAKYASILYLIKNAEAVNTGALPPEQLGARAIDNKTLEITLEHAAPYLPNLLTHYTTFPVPRHVVEKLGNDWIKAENIVVNGPFKLVQWKPNDFIHLVKNDSFYDAVNVCLNHVYYYPTWGDVAAERQIRNGTLDVQTNFSGSRLEELNQSLPGYARVHPYIGLTYYIFNFKKPVFEDVKVREAISMAIDRDFITDKILKGGQTPAYSLVPPGIQNYDVASVAPSWKGLDRAARLERARTLLAEAGYGPNKPLEMSMQYRGSGDNPKVVPIVQANLKDIAPWVTLELVSADVQVNYEKLRTGDFTFGDAGWVADFNDAQNYLMLFETRTDQWNYGKYSNPEYDRLMAQANVEPDGARRADIMKQAEQILINDSAFVPVFFLTNRNLVNPRITGWVDNANDQHRSRYLCTTEAAGAAAPAAKK